LAFSSTPEAERLFHFVTKKRIGKRMNIKNRSLITFFALLAVLIVAVGLNTMLPQGIPGKVIPASTIPQPQLALAAAGITAVLYGLLGFLGLMAWRNLGFPEIWEKDVSNRQRFLLPALLGIVFGIILILSDLMFSNYNGIGRLMHPPFPTSLVASISAGIGEEMIFRLFFISVWTWLVGKLILRGRGLTIVYWIFAVVSALSFAAGHLPSLMILLGVNDPSQFSPVLLLEIFLLNGLISIGAAYYFKKFGFLAAVGVHLWTDIVWHMVWGLM
jgi:hypothetical protein